MTLLKENGSLDIEWINNLPLEERLNIVGSLTSEQYQEFWNSLPINESKEHTKAVHVDYTIEDLLEQGYVNFADLLNNLRKNEGND